MESRPVEVTESETDGIGTSSEEEEGNNRNFMENTISGSVMRDNPNLENRKPENQLSWIWHGDYPWYC